jgi:hypothetical protein
LVKVMKNYWYHLSTHLERIGTFTLKPWGRDIAHNRDNDEPDGERIPVAPSIAQCLVALPLYRGAVANVYRTENQEEAMPSTGIFDVELTEEHWLTNPTKFVYFGKLALKDIEDENPGGVFDFDVCCLNDVSKSKLMLDLYKEIKPEWYIKE